MSPDQYRKVMIALIAVVVVVAAIFAFWHISDVQARRAACERNKADRAQNALGWTFAERARRESYRQTGLLLDLRAANQYRGIVAGLKARAAVDCADQYPYLL